MVDPPLDPPFALLLPMTRQSPLPYVRGPVHAPPPVLRPVEARSSAQGPRQPRLTNFDWNGGMGFKFEWEREMRDARWSPSLWVSTGDRSEGDIRRRRRLSSRMGCSGQAESRADQAKQLN